MMSEFWCQSKSHNCCSLKESLPAEFQVRLRSLCRLSTVFIVHLMRRVAGAGGYDAVFCIVLEEGVQKVVDLWESWEELHVCPLPIEFDHRGVIVDAS
jgi:hypothetical protein